MCCVYHAQRTGGGLDGGNFKMITSDKTKISVDLAWKKFPPITNKALDSDNWVVF